MSRISVLRLLCLSAILGVLAWASPALPQPIPIPRNPPPMSPPPAPAKPAPRLEAVAETRLLMDGLAQSNFRGLEKLLKDKPTDLDTWVFARGQAILIAETANLLMLRPPSKPQGQDAWMDRSKEMREAASSLARAIAAKDHAKSKAALGDLGNACTACHKTFRVNVKVVAFEEPATRALDKP